MVTLKKGIQILAGPIVAAGTVIALLSGVPAHCSRDSYVGTVTAKRYSAGGRNVNSQGIVQIIGTEGKKNTLIVGNSILEGKLNSAREYLSLKVGEPYCFKTYGFETEYIPYLYGLHVIRIDSPEKCQ